MGCDKKYWVIQIRSDSTFKKGGVFWWKFRASSSSSCTYTYTVFCIFFVNLSMEWAHYTHQAKMCKILQILDLKEKIFKIIKFDQSNILHQSALFVKSKPSQLYRERTTCTTSMFRVNVTTKTASVTYLFCLVLHLTSKKKYLPTYLYLQVCTRRGFNFQNITPLMSIQLLINQTLSAVITVI